MRKPTADEFQKALDEAERMREHDEDPQFIAKTLLNLQHRIGFLEKVMHAAELYLRGEGGREHTLLLRAIEKVKQEDARCAGHDARQFLS